MSIFTDAINPVTGLFYNPLGNITEPLKSVTIKEAANDSNTYKVSDSYLDIGSGRSIKSEPAFLIEHKVRQFPLNFFFFDYIQILYFSIVLINFLLLQRSII